MARRIDPKKVGLGVAAATAAAAAAAAGYYFYASKDAKRNRRIAAKWATNLKRDVVRQAKKVRDIDREQLFSIIDGAADAYRKARTIDPGELTRATKELRENWRELLGEMQKGSGAAKKRARKTTRKKKSAKSSR